MANSAMSRDSASEGIAEVNGRCQGTWALLAACIFFGMGDMSCACEKVEYGILCVMFLHSARGKRNIYEEGMQKFICTAGRNFTLMSNTARRHPRLQLSC